MPLCQAAPFKSGLPANAFVIMHSGLFVNEQTMDTVRIETSVKHSRPLTSAGILQDVYPEEDSKARKYQFVGASQWCHPVC